MNNVLTLVIGLPRSGKSTWIEKNKGDAIVVSHDWVRENILGTHYAPSANAIIWTIADAALRILLSQDKDVILDGLNDTPTVRKFYVDIARQYKAKVKMVGITTPLDICLARNSGKEQKLRNKKILKINEKLEWPRVTECDELVFWDGCW